METIFSMRMMMVGSMFIHMYEHLEINVYMYVHKCIYIYNVYQPVYVSMLCMYVCK